MKTCPVHQKTDCSPLLNGCSRLTVKREEISAYSENTGKTYDNWDALVAAEANGYVVVLTSTRTDTVPWVVGPYVSKQEATKARVRLRRRAQKEEAGYQVRTLIRVLWKEKP